MKERRSMGEIGTKTGLNATKTVWSKKEDESRFKCSLISS